ncbi:10567_t:CDS:2 [Entrophospora sp. SA101]|nr:17070_t:CDS:2 [Entrophospora sp. SA101]CAJ0830962.1 10567_t:CDS:2 [Entrophospora sp. SA101]CAJ0918659.1 19258_t:CDS:2 [Entrophospora sp. SA101]
MNNTTTILQTAIGRVNVALNVGKQPPESMIDNDDTDEENIEENSMFSNDINEVSLSKQSKTESKWKLKDGHLIVDVLNAKFTEMVKLALEKDKKEQHNL